LSQTWHSKEVIVIDDGSVDGSRELLKSWDSQCKIIFQDNRGAAAARNRGLTEAKGQYIQFLDADDLLLGDKIELQVRLLQQSPPGRMASGPWARFRQNIDEAVFDPEEVWAALSPKEFLMASWLGGGMMPIFAWLTPRNVLDRGGPWEEGLSVNDDGEYFTRAVMASTGIVFCGEARGFYRTHSPITLSNRHDWVAANSDFSSINKSCSYLLSKDSSSSIRRACAAAYQRFAFRYYPDYLDLTQMAEIKVRELGGSDLAMGESATATIARRLLGWKTVKRLQRLKRLGRIR
jgi:glycosyltransferase involved in cell wall biosynthesis